MPGVEGINTVFEITCLPAADEVLVYAKIFGKCEDRFPLISAQNDLGSPGEFLIDGIRSELLKASDLLLI